MNFIETTKGDVFFKDLKQMQYMVKEKKVRKIRQYDMLIHEAPPTKKLKKI